MFQVYESHYYIECIKRATIETIAMIEVVNGGLPGPEYWQWNLEVVID